MTAFRVGFESWVAERKASSFRHHIRAAVKALREVTGGRPPKVAARRTR
jgi:predicted trehalose synthase